MKALIVILLLAIGCAGFITDSPVVWSVLGIILLIVGAWIMSSGKEEPRSRPHHERDREIRNHLLSEEAKRHRIIRKTH